jgi:hypothetical protein
MKTIIKRLVFLALLMYTVSLYNCEKDSVETEVIGKENE